MNDDQALVDAYASIYNKKEEIKEEVKEEVKDEEAKVEEVKEEENNPDSTEVKND